MVQFNDLELVKYNTWNAETFKGLVTVFFYINSQRLVNINYTHYN